VETKKLKIMGACTFRTTNSGKTMKEAYDSACEIAIEEYGHQEGYNGTITTTHGFRDVTSDFKRSKKELSQFISDAYDKLNKRDCWGICIDEPKENKNKTKSQVEHIVEKGTKKWVLKYVVYDYDNLIGSYNTKGDAVKSARAYTEKTQKRTTISMEKKLEKGNNQVARITYKPSPNEKNGKYIFFGWAAE
jgi:hypothetical protein